MRKIIFSIMGLLFFSVLDSTSANNISDKKLEKFKSIQQDIEVVLPKYIPEGFKINDIKISITDESKSSVVYHISYIKYLNNQKYSFRITGSSGYVVALVYDNPTTITTKFGHVDMYIDPTINSTKYKINNYILLDWICYKNNCYSFSSGTDSKHQKNVEITNRISKDEAIKIISSLDFLYESD